MKVRQVKRFRSSSAMAACAAGLFRRALRLSRAPAFTVALPGGKTPLELFKALAAAALPWDRVHFFMSDERLVPRAAAGSNFGQARRRLFSKINIPAGNLHPVRNSSPAAAAAAYEKELRTTAGPAGVIDIVILGLGEDGHTASLFAGSPAPGTGNKLAGPSLAPAGAAPRRRVTLTPEAINRAALVVLMAAGPAKKNIFKAAAKGNKSIPAGALRPRGGYYLLFSEK